MKESEGWAFLWDEMEKVRKGLVEGYVPVTQGEVYTHAFMVNKAAGINMVREMVDTLIVDLKATADKLQADELEEEKEDE